MVNRTAKRKANRSSKRLTTLDAKRSELRLSVGIATGFDSCEQIPCGPRSWMVNLSREAVRIGLPIPIRKAPRNQTGLITRTALRVATALSIR